MVERFPVDVAEILRGAGWFLGRRVDEQVVRAVGVVSGYVGRQGAVTKIFPAAVEALTEFGGLRVIQDGSGRDLRRRPFAIDPTEAAATTETLAELGRLLGTKLFPLGFEGFYDSVLAIDQAGRVFALDHAGTWYLGETIDAALIGLIRGTQPPRLDERGRW